MRPRCATSPSGPPSQQRVGRFKGIDARIAGGVSARSATETIETERDFSIRDKDDIVARIERKLKRCRRRGKRPCPHGVRPGFLMAVAELVNDTMAARRNGDRVVAPVEGPHDRATSTAGPLRSQADRHPARCSVRRPAARSGALVHADFETTNRTTGNRNTFELEYATDGPLAGVPTLIRHKPRWWLEAVLTLDEGSAPPGRH